MHGDEAVHAWFSWNMYRGAGYQYDPVYHGPLQFIITPIFFFLFGVSNTSARLMSILFGSVLVVLPYFLRRHMGRIAALIAALYIAVSPAFTYVSRLERDDSFTVLFALTMAIGIWGLVRTCRARYLYLFAASAALSLSAMENSYITYFIFGTFLIDVFLTEWLCRRRGERLHQFWLRTGTHSEVKWTVLAGLGAILLAALVLTVVTGLYLPVPLVLAITIALLVHRQTVFRTVEDDGYTFLQAVGSFNRTQWLNALTIVVAILFINFSSVGTNVRGIWDATQPFFNSGSACPGNPFPLNPCRKDIIGGLFYWLSQHRVHRGGQPWFYYILLYGLYEQIAVFFGMAAAVWTLRRPTLFTSFLLFWSVLAFGIYSWAGEKFPWLIVHSLLPIVLLASTFLGWLLLAPSFLTAKRIVLAALALLAIVEVHNMFELNFVNGADPVEMMVYVQSAPDTPRVAQQILTISNKVDNDLTMPVTIDTLDTWPFAWYLRDMPNAGYPASAQMTQKPYSTNPVIIADESDQPLLAPLLRGKYTGKRYILRWWFPEAYKTLTWSSAARDIVNPGIWRVIWDWFTIRRPFGPKGAVHFYLYIKKGLVPPF